MSACSCRLLAPIAFIAGASLGLSSAAQDQSQPRVLRLESRDARPTATLADVSWLAGHWQGEMFGGVAEALWAPPMGSSMMGAYRLVKDGQVSFYELMIIVEDAGSLVMKVKHFHPDLAGWEERDGLVEFPLVKVTPDEIFFDGLTYQRTGENTRQGVILVASKDGEEEVEFAYRRVSK